MEAVTSAVFPVRLRQRAVLKYLFGNHTTYLCLLVNFLGNAIIRIFQSMTVNESKVRIELSKK